MNYCRKTELFPKDESETEIIHIHDIKNDKTEKSKTISDINKTQNDENYEKIDLNLIKIVEDIVERILEKKFPSKRMKNRVLDLPIISKFAFKPLVNQVKSPKNLKVEKTKISSKRKKTAPKSKTKILKSNNWIYLGK
jgi:hypothetical protein